MSRIIPFWKCEKCNYEFYQYVSFGHPDEDFIFKWVCPECKSTNELKVEAFPDVSAKAIQHAFDAKTIKLSDKMIDAIKKELKTDEEAIKNWWERRKSAICITKPPLTVTPLTLFLEKFPETT